MTCGWEGNRGSGVALAMRRRLQWVIHLRAHGLRKGDGHPAYIPDGLRHTLPYLTVRARDGGGQMSAMLSDESGNVRGGANVLHSAVASRFVLTASTETACCMSADRRQRSSVSVVSHWSS